MSENKSELASALAELQASIAASESAAEGDSNDAEFAAAADLRDAAERFVAIAQSSLAHRPQPARLGYLFRPVHPVFLLVGTRVHASSFREAHGLRHPDVVAATTPSDSPDWLKPLEVRRVELVYVESWSPVHEKDVVAVNASIARAEELNDRNGWPLLAWPQGVSA